MWGPPPHLPRASDLQRVERFAPSTGRLSRQDARQKRSGVNHPACRAERGCDMCVTLFPRQPSLASRELGDRPLPSLTNKEPVLRRGPDCKK